jgi:ketosteroid isomerase-like protein
VAELNREIAGRAFAAVAQDDLEGFLALVEPDVQFNSLIAEAEGKTYRGHDGVREWWETIKPLLGGLRWEREEIREVGEDRILVSFRVVGSLEGAPLAQTMFQAVRGRAGKIAWWGVFRTEAEALDALAVRDE